MHLARKCSCAGARMDSGLQMRPIQSSLFVEGLPWTWVFIVPQIKNITIFLKKFCLPQCCVEIISQNFIVYKNRLDLNDISYRIWLVHICVFQNSSYTFYEYSRLSFVWKLVENAFHVLVKTLSHYP